MGGALDAHDIAATSTNVLQHVILPMSYNISYLCYPCVRHSGHSGHSALINPFLNVRIAMIGGTTCLPCLQTLKQQKHLCFNSEPA